MPISRRHLLAGLAASAWAQPNAPPVARTGPVLCVYSRLLPEIDYSEMPPILKGLGVDGCDLSVEPGGTVIPVQSAVDLVRAIESIRGDGLELPIVTTSFLSVTEPGARNCLAIIGNSGVSFLRTGYSRSPERLQDRRADFTFLTAYSRAARLVTTIPYPAGERLGADLDRDWTGWDYDPARTLVSGSLDAALPRIRSILLRDARREKDGLTPCPLGEGDVDWPALFGALAKKRFSGPLTVWIDYQPKDRLQALRKDIEFARKQIVAAFTKEVQ